VLVTQISHAFVGCFLFRFFWVSSITVCYWFNGRFVFLLRGSGDLMFLLVFSENAALPTLPIWLLNQLVIYHHIHEVFDSHKCNNIHVAFLISVSKWVLVSTKRRQLMHRNITEWFVSLSRDFHFFYDLDWV